jgi:hypothetical protein
MRGDRVGGKYEVRFVVTEQQRDAYAEAIRKTQWLNRRSGEYEPIRLTVTRTTGMLGVKGWRLAVQTKGDEWACADTAVTAYVDATFPIGTRCVTVVPLYGKPTERPVGTLATVTGSDGWGAPRFTFDGDPVEYICGAWWFEVVSS